MVSGFLKTDGQTLGREVWGVLNALLVAEDDAGPMVEALRQNPYPGRHWVPEAPEDHYTFAGEVPWHPHFAHDHDDYAPEPFYSKNVDVTEDATVDAEILGHLFSWEGYHSSLNQAGHPYLPSRTFSEAFDLRSLPQIFWQVEPDGTPAAVAVSAPARYTGQLLYLRTDLVRRYANGRKLIWFLWGERLPHPYPNRPDQRIDAIRELNGEVWRHIEVHGWE
jgi:hypothetical protein